MSIRIRKGLRAAGRAVLPGMAVVGCFAAAFAQTAPASGPDDDSVRINAPKLAARFSADSVGIGDHFTFRVEVEKDLVQQIEFPQFPNKRINEHLEILAELPPDTVAAEGRRLTIGKQYLLTTFDEGLHIIDSFPVLYLDKNITDTIWAAGPFFLEVGTFEIDTAAQTIHDIKLPVKAPFRLGEAAGYVSVTLLILALIALGVYLWIRHRNRLPRFLAPKPKLPPHVTAIRALEALHHQKLWQNNRHKQYYTILTDILREYLHGRYGVRAMEMTSDETLTAMRGRELSPKLLADLSSLLYTSDLVKFAKFVPADDDNETAYYNAYYFVEETKEAVEAAVENPDTPVPPVFREKPDDKSADDTTDDAQTPPEAGKEVEP